MKKMYSCPEEMQIKTTETTRIVVIKKVVANVGDYVGKLDIFLVRM